MNFDDEVFRTGVRFAASPPNYMIKFKSSKVIFKEDMYQKYPYEVITVLDPYYKVFVTKIYDRYKNAPVSERWYYDCDLPKEREAKIKYLHKLHTEVVLEIYNGTDRKSVV